MTAKKATTKKPKMYAQVEICFFTTDDDVPSDPYWILHLRKSPSDTDVVARIEEHVCDETVPQARASAKRMAKLLGIEITEETSAWCLACNRKK